MPCIRISSFANRQAPLAAAVLGCIAAGGALAQGPTQPDGEWRGSFALSATLSSGNTESRNFAAKLDAARERVADKWSLYGTALYGKREVDSGDEKTADNLRLGARYDYNLSERVFSFGLAEYERDRIADLDYRATLGLGLGYHLVKSERDAFDVFSGVAHTRSRYDPSSPALANGAASGTATELLLGEESNHKLSETLSVKQKLTVYPSLDGGGEFRSVFDSALVIALNAHLGLQVGLQNRYTSEVPVGVKKSDTQLMTGLNIKFGP
jgi:putative salt-induced outer membrane protein